MNREFAKLTVSQVNEYLAMLVDSNDILNGLAVVGEISNFKYYQSSGHMYFSLKDESGILKAVMFRTYCSRLKFMPEDGMRVIAGGKIGIYSQSGVYQLYVTSMEEDGKGKAAYELEKLKKKLLEEGLFDEDKKRPLPGYPFSVGVITSSKGAAVHDIINVITRRFPAANLTICPAAVQGDDAPRSLTAAVSYFNTHGHIDVLIIGRGGGSGEDLSAFNSEALVREIAKSPVPVISAVGHETDFTLCDFVADCRAPTPSAAAELVCPDIKDVLDDILNTENYIKTSLANKISYLEERLGSYSALTESRSPSNIIGNMREKLQASERQIKAQCENALAILGKELEKRIYALSALNPLSVLKRGYSIVEKEEKSISSVLYIGKDDEISVKMSDGSIKATVNEIIENGDKTNG